MKLHAVHERCFHRLNVFLFKSRKPRVPTVVSSIILAAYNVGIAKKKLKPPKTIYCNVVYCHFLC